MSRSLLLCLALASVGLLAGGTLEALPRMTLTAGSRCSNCHVNPQGSGLRTADGYMNETAQNGMVTWDKLGWQKFHDVEDNTFLGGKLTVGGDLRLQMAKLGAPAWKDDGTIKEPKRLFIPMQGTLAAMFKVTDWLSLAGSFNTMGLVKTYQGQSLYDGWVQVQTSQAAPRLRVGMLQPGIGIRHDDHTLLLRRNPFALGKPVIPPNYNDPGIELSYEGLHWLTIDTSVVWRRNLALTYDDSAPTDNTSKLVDLERSLAFSGRVTVFPQVLDWGLNSYAGASILQAKNLRLLGGHVGIGNGYWGSLLAEVVSGDNSGRAWTSTLVQATYRHAGWLNVEARWERSWGTDASQAGAAATMANVTSYVGSVQWFVLPNVELRPEYRWLQTKEWTVAQYALQMHLWF